MLQIMDAFLAFNWDKLHPLPPGVGGPEGSKPLSPQFMLPPDIQLSARWILSYP